jgi:hypothetical protein
MTHPVIWAVVERALTGAALDVPGRTLHLALAPDGGEIVRLRLPVLLPVDLGHRAPGAEAA